MTRAKWLALVVIGGATAVVACSSSTIVEGGGGAFGRSGGVGPVGSTGGAVPTDPPRCPADPPTNFTSCSGFASICTYGPDVRDACVGKQECSGGRWQDATGYCEVPCPTHFAEIVPGTTCGDREMACSYDEGTCGCFNDDPQLPPPDDSGVTDASSSDGGDGGKDGGVTKPLVPGVWKCVAPPGDVICPSARPRVLDACVKPVTCDYGTCELGRDLSYDCAGGIWQPSASSPSCDP